jgi:predicted dienelactone hydrolase
MKTYPTHMRDPTGPYEVGRIDRLVTDPSRRNRYGDSTNGSFMVAVWYPAEPNAGGEFEPFEKYFWNDARWMPAELLDRLRHYHIFAVRE